MAYKLNVDMWHVVNPEDQKLYRLSRGDEVPAWALPEGDDLKAVTDDARVPLFIQDEAPAASSPMEPTAVRESNRAAAAAEKK